VLFTNHPHPARTGSKWSARSDADEMAALAFGQPKKPKGDEGSTDNHTAARKARFLTYLPS